MPSGWRTIVWEDFNGHSILHAIEIAGHLCYPGPQSMDQAIFINLDDGPILVLFHRKRNTVGMVEQNRVF